MKSEVLLKSTMRSVVTLLKVSTEVIGSRKRRDDVCEG